METRFEIFMGILSFLCFAIFFSIVVARAVKWLQKWYKYRQAEKDLEQFAKSTSKKFPSKTEVLGWMKANDSAADMALDPKPWGHLPDSEQKYLMNCLNCGELRHFAPNKGPGPSDRACSVCGLGLWTKEAQERGMKPMDIMPSAIDEFQKQPRLERPAIIETPNTMWCPECGNEKRYLAHAVGGVPYFKCDSCGTCFKQAQPVRWDRNAVQTDTPAPASPDLVIIENYPPEEMHLLGSSGLNDSPNLTEYIGPVDHATDFGGGDFGGSGAGDSYDSSSDSGSSSSDSSSSSDYSTSSDD